MPVIEIKMYPGRTEEQKARLVEELTKAACKTIDCKPEAVTVVISEIPKGNRVFGGKKNG